ncbi:MAG: serine hydrolase domain-containing protein [Flavobacteriaceae bacterium]
MYAHDSTKKHGMHYLGIFLFLLFTSVVQAQQLEKITPEAVGMSSQRLQRLNTVLENYVENKQLPGAVVMISRKGKIVHTATVGYRDYETKDPIRENTIFRIASQTKAIVSVGIMTLLEQGKLLLDDPVGNYIPEFNTTTVAVKDGATYKVVPANRKITIRDLLTHTAGIGYGWGLAHDQWKKAGITGWYFAHRKAPILETVKAIAHLPQEAQPGEKYVYGYNTDILGALIEVVAQQPLDVFLQQRVLDPLGMKDTYFYLPPKLTDRLATVYSPTENGLNAAPVGTGMQAQGEYVKGPRTSFSGGAGYLSTALDYSKFLQMMLNKGVYNGQRLLSRKSVELMLENHIGTKFPWGKGQGFGLGFSIHLAPGESGIMGSVGDFGWGGAYHSVYWADPTEELAVVYFTQLIPANDIDDHKKLRNLVYQAIID